MLIRRFKLGVAISLGAGAGIRIRPDQALDLDQRRLEAALVADPEHEAALGTRVHHLPGVGERSASGFSQNTCLPAAAAARTWFLCSECGVARITAWIPGSASAASRLEDSGRPCSAAKGSAASGLTSTKPTRWSFGSPRALHDGPAPSAESHHRGADHRGLSTSMVLLIFGSPSKRFFGRSSVGGLDQTRWVLDV